MIVLDTNVISELFKPEPDPGVVAWVARLPGNSLFTTAITRGELLFGLYRMPDGQRKADLLQRLALLFERELAEHIIAYDSDAADAHAAFAAARRAQGRPVGMADAMIAGIAQSRGAQLATRNVRDFEGCGIALVDPWH